MCVCIYILYTHTYTLYTNDTFYSKTIIFVCLKRHVSAGSVVSLSHKEKDSGWFYLGPYRYKDRSPMRVEPFENSSRKKKVQGESWSGKYLLILLLFSRVSL